MVNFHRMKAARGGLAVCQVFAVFVENGELAARSLGFAVFDAGGAMVG